MKPARYNFRQFKKQRVVVKHEEHCVFCHNSAVCARFPFDDERPDNGLGPWCCGKCWKRAMKERRRHNDRLAADSPDRLRVLPWPRYAKKPLPYKTQGNTVTIRGDDLIRFLFGGPEG